MHVPIKEIYNEVFHAIVNTIWTENPQEKELLELCQSQAHWEILCVFRITLVIPLLPHIFIIDQIIDHVLILLSECHKYLKILPS